MELTAQFSGWHSVIKEFQKEIDGSGIQVTCFLFLDEDFPKYCLIYYS